MTDLIKHTYHTVHAYTLIAFTLNNSEKNSVCYNRIWFPKHNKYAIIYVRIISMGW